MFSFHSIVIIPIGHLAGWSTGGWVNQGVDWKSVYLAQLSQ